MDRNTESKTLQTTATSIEILELLDELEGARVTEVAEHMGIPKSTIHGHLATLRTKQFVSKRGDSYYLGPELLRLGNRVRTRKKGYVFAREYTERLVDRVGFRSVFATEMGGRAVFIHKAAGNKMEWAHERLGNRLYLHDTAVGKAILAELPRRRVEQILDEWGLPRETDNTITDRDELFAELEAIREQGYATNHEENLPDLHGIGVAATEQSGSVIGGFSITGPKHSFTEENRERQLADAVMEVVSEYELELSLV
ncbi:IclR family transcriptional regulator (plasmid) [Haloarcula salina]|uniref:IclR family transcriptional regulator n=1 Tax=Haloarcula salina TaxID=1429914 RepID=UPI003C6F1B13